MDEWNIQEGKVKKVLVLVQCLECKNEFYLNRNDLIEKFDGYDMVLCKACKKMVKVIRV